MRKPVVTIAALVVGNRKTAKIDLNGTTYELAYDFNSIVDTEREACANLLHGLQNIAHLSALQLRGLFLASIRAADPASKMTISDAGALITYDSILPVAEAIAQSILLSLPETAMPPLEDSEPAAEPAAA